VRSDVALKITEVRAVQPAKAEAGMLVTESGMVMEVRPVLPWKRDAGMLVTLEPSTTETAPAPNREDGIVVRSPFSVRLTLLAPNTVIGAVTTDAGTTTERSVPELNAYPPRDVMELGRVTELRYSQLSKAKSGMLVSVELELSEAEVKEPQSLNALVPREVRLIGVAILVRPLPLNADWSIVVTEEGSVICDSLLHPRNAELPTVVRDELTSKVTLDTVVFLNRKAGIVVTEGPMCTDAISDLLKIFELVKDVAAEFHEISRFVVLEKTSVPNVVTDSGIVICRSEVQFLNAESPMVVSCGDVPKVTVVRLDNPVKALAAIDCTPFGMKIVVIVGPPPVPAKRAAVISVTPPPADHEVLILYSCLIF